MIRVLAEAAPEASMNTLIPIALTLALVTAPAAHAQAPAIERAGVYVVAADVARTAAFYEKLFGRAPQVRTPTLVGFDVAGGFYAVISRQAFAPDAKPGVSAAPYLKVRDIDAWFQRVTAMAPEAKLVTAKVVREGPFSLLKFQDPDGNLVELYAVETTAAR
jgi:predicted enzyme related to lactoylglutathione lyase